MSESGTTDALVAALGWPSAPARLEEALTHPSYSNEQRRRGGAHTPDYQRLEFLGDAVLGMCVSEILMETRPGADEGELSRMRSALVKAEALAAFARALGIGEALRLGRGADAAGDRYQTNVLADAVEALVAAAYLEGGIDQARELVRRVIAEGLARASELGELDPKSELQERVQGAGRRAPTYRVGRVGGPDHDRWFEIEVLDGEEVLARGRGKSKKVAEREAARAALEAITTKPAGKPIADNTAIDDTTTHAAAALSPIDAVPEPEPATGVEARDAVKPEARITSVGEPEANS